MVVLGCIGSGCCAGDPPAFDGQTRGFGSRESSLFRYECHDKRGSVGGRGYRLLLGQLTVLPQAIV